VEKYRGYNSTLSALPLFLRNWTRDCIDAAGIARLAGEVAAKNSSNEIQRQNDKQYDARNCHLQTTTCTTTHMPCIRIYRRFQLSLTSVSTGYSRIELKAHVTRESFLSKVAIKKTFYKLESFMHSFSVNNGRRQLSIYKQISLNQSKCFICKKLISRTERVSYCKSRFWNVNRYQTNHGWEWNGSGSVVADSNEVYEESRATHQNWQQQRTQQHLLDPQLTCTISTTVTKKNCIH